MASANGVLSPPPQPHIAANSPQLSAKRKRADSSDPSEKINGTADTKVPNMSSSDKVRADSQQDIDDFIEVLKSYESSPSILNRQLPARESSAEPHPKRQKSDSDTDTSTIIKRAISGSYSTLEDVYLDIKAACSTILEDLQPPNGVPHNQYTPISDPTTEIASKVKTFKMIAEQILERELAFRSRRSSRQMSQSMDTARPLTNGISPTSNGTIVTTVKEDAKKVLTLFGNAPGPKQLFSSLQQNVKAADGRTDLTQPLREIGLPNGIGTTQIVPPQASGLLEEKKHVPTMGELFTNSGSSLPFQPPRPSHHASTRSSTVGWYQPTMLDMARSRNAQSYSFQSISTGVWLDYNGASTVVDAKRKQRERALSLGGVKVSLSLANSAEQESAKLDALFRSAYSSFAPVKDDAAAIVPTGTLNTIWWQRTGERTFERLVKNSANIEAVTKSNEMLTTASTLEDQEKTSNQMEEFRKVVEDWDELAIDPNLEQTETDPKPIQDKDVEEILQEISELLETLNSYQRIRNLTLNPLPRSGGTSSSADPAKPTEAEIATYNTLKSQLALMIAMLPPYAVAKLDSDQLAGLNISTKIQILTDTYKGVMEEDEAAARAKVAEMRAATNSRPTPSTSLHRSTSSLYGNQYSSSPRPAIPGAQQYFSQSQTPVRPPSANLQRPPSTAAVPYAGQRPSSSTPYRPQSNYPTPTYPHQLPRTSVTQYGTPTSQQYLQNSTTSSFGQTPAPSYSSMPGSTPQTSLSARYQPSVQGAYQQNRQVPQNGIDYRYSNGNNSARQSSPQKPLLYASQVQIPQSQSRPYGTPSMANDNRYYQSSITNGTSGHSSQPQVSQSQSASLGATGYHTVMTAEQQSTMMERQRAQLAQQQGTQQHARNAAQAGAMGVSPGTQINGGNAVTAGL